MSKDPFTHMFPEWMLSESLNKCSCRERLWTSNFVQTSHGTNGKVSLASLFSHEVPPQIQFERVLTKGENELFQIESELWEKNFWGLRPDFTIEDKQDGLLVLIEAKGGQVPARTWMRPKELLYYRFLEKCSGFPKKGIFYIVPQTSLNQCRKCLTDYFPRTDRIVHGAILWEDLVPMISHELLGCAVDFVIRELEGVRELRKYEREAL